MHPEICPRPLKTQETCEKTVGKEPYTLDYVPDQYKTQEMCDNVVHRRP